MQVTIGTISGKLAKAQAANSTANSFQTMQPIRGNSAIASAFTGGSGGSECPRSLFLIPYGEGAAGSQFSLRVFGLNHPQAPNQGDAAAVVWVPYFIAEFLCTLCFIGGVRQGSDALSGVDLIETERLCDTIQLVQGDLGVVGRVNSTGPGTDLVAYATVDLQGCRKFAFDFKQTDNIGMNCLWTVL